MGHNVAHASRLGACRQRHIYVVLSPHRERAFFASAKKRASQGAGSRGLRTEDPQRGSMRMHATNDEADPGSMHHSEDGQEQIFDLRRLNPGNEVVYTESQP